MNKKIYYPLEENYEIIKKIYGNSFLENIENDKLNVQDCLLANEILAEKLYGVDIYKALKDNNLDIIKNKFNELRNNQYGNSILKNFDFNNIGIIVIRPENIGLIDQYENLLTKRGLDVIYKKKIKIDFEQYLLIYLHGLLPKESRYDFPTRTLNYINKDCYLIFVHSNNPKMLPISDYLTSFKGKQGINQIGTLRGDIAYNGLQKYLLHNGLGFNNKKFNVLFDPIGMCRLLVRNQIPSDNSHNIADLKLLYYVGQAVHVPNSHEIIDDFRVLCDENDIDSLEQKIKKLKK